MLSWRGFTSLYAAVLLSIPLEVGGQDPGPLSPASGTLVVRITLPSEVTINGNAQAVLMPPEWAQAWNRDAQLRIDEYSNRYQGLLARDPDSFAQISRMAQRDAVVSVVLQMQGRLGPDFLDLVRPVPPEGRFEYRDVPQGEYKIVVLVEGSREPMIWMEAVSLQDSIPLFVELEDRIW